MGNNVINKHIEHNSVTGTEVYASYRGCPEGVTFLGNHVNYACRMWLPIDVIKQSKGLRALEACEIPFPFTKGRSSALVGQGDLGAL